MKIKKQTLPYIFAGLFFVCVIGLLLNTLLSYRGMMVDHPMVNQSAITDIPYPLFDAYQPFDPTKTVEPFDNYDGVVLLNFFASWCGQCRFQVPVFGELRGRYSNDKLKIIGVFYGDNQIDARNYLKSNELPFDQVIFDGRGQIASEWGIMGIPATFVVGSNGKVCSLYMGPVSSDDFAESINGGLKGC